MRRFSVLSAVAMATFLAAAPAGASSHREAPFVTKNPKVDGTDFYMFRSFEAGRGEFVTLVANYLPLQDAYGGPNYFSMDPDALYEIHIDNNGNNEEDITFQFRFQNTLAAAGKGIELSIGPADAGKMVAIPLLNASPLDGGAGNLLSVAETYSLKVVTGNRRSGTAADVTAPGGGTTFKKPTDYVGEKTFGNEGAYEAYAGGHVYNVQVPSNVTGCTNRNAKVFVGQRRESFAVNLGTVFDLVNAPGGAITDVGNRGAFDSANPIQNKNITSLAIEVHRSCLTAGADPVIGGWTTASVRQARVINPNATYDKPAREGGAWAQVSRLGNPLVNEVVIGLPDKDKFNSSEPKNDAANFLKYVEYPTLPALLEVLFGSASVAAPTLFPRADLRAVFLTGVPSVTAPAGGMAASDMLRLNTTLGGDTIFDPVAAGPSGGHWYGAALCFPNDNLFAPPNAPYGDGGTTTVVPTDPLCDPFGFPNGRRPTDDVTDIALMAAMGYLLPVALAPNSGVVFHDGVAQENFGHFTNTFPYLGTPVPGARTPAL